MTTEQKLSMLEGLCERAYGMGKAILDPNVKDADLKVKAMIRVTGAFMGAYDSYKKRVRMENTRVQEEGALKELKDKRDRENGSN